MAKTWGIWKQNTSGQIPFKTNKTPNNSVK